MVIVIAIVFAIVIVIVIVRVIVIDIIILVKHAKCTAFFHYNNYPYKIIIAIYNDIIEILSDTIGCRFYLLIRNTLALEERRGIVVHASGGYPNPPVDEEHMPYLGQIIRPKDSFYDNKQYQSRPKPYL